MRQGECQESVLPVSRLWETPAGPAASGRLVRLLVRRARDGADGPWTYTDAMSLRADYPVRRTTLERQGSERDVAHLTPSERVQMVWTLSVQAWRFKEQLPDELRLRRDVVRTLRGRR